MFIEDDVFEFEISVHDACGMNRLESKGYLSFRAASLASHDPADWQRADDIDFGALKKRHGAILPITAAEYDAIETAFAL